jgi:SOS-response transcriptional repressor LexA
MMEVLDFIVRWVEDRGYQPSQAEMAAAFGITKNAVGGRLQGLADRGIIGPLEGDRERAIRLRFIKFRSYVPETPKKKS